MSTCTLIVGGARSGKSDFAENYAEKIVAQEQFYIATCPVFNEPDPEMTARIQKHKEKRKGKGWQTMEEGVDLCSTVKNIPEDALVLIDCLTLWVSNQLFKYGENNVSEPDIENHIHELLLINQQRSGELVMVSGEVGCSIVPENALARRYRDLVGRCNQTVGKCADNVFLVSCGIPTQIKG